MTGRFGGIACTLAAVLPAFVFAAAPALAAGPDLTVTTLSDAAVGDKVLVTGRVAVDKDVGHGTPYAVIVEDATLNVEK